jgi:transposase
MSACVCGLDVHKESTYATILTPEGKIVNQMKMSNDKVLMYLSRFNVSKVAMESSNQVAALYRKLKNKGYQVIVSHPRKTRYIAEAKIKSDRVDSKVIAELTRLDGKLQTKPSRSIFQPLQKIEVNKQNV